jgi:hypothetical protein
MSENQRVMPIRQNEGSKYSISNNSQRINPNARVNNTNRSHQRSNYSRSQNLSQVSHNKRSDNRAERSSQRSENSKSSKTKVSNYRKISDTTVSDPANLICDICVNQRHHDNKVREIEEQKEIDKAFANEINNELKRQLEAEREKEKEKRQIYKDALENQRKDMEERLAHELDNQKKEDERIREALANDSDIRARNAELEEKKQGYIQGLKNQLLDNQDKLKNLEAQEKLLDERNPNLLINDAWRIPAREAMKEYYKNNLINQLREKDQREQELDEKKKNDDKDYIENLKQLIKNEEDKKRQLNEKKRKIFVDELQKQLNDKELQEQLKKELYDKEVDDVKKKLEHDNDVYLENMFKKKNQMQDYIDDIKNQMGDDEQKKIKDKQEAKKAVNTGINMGHKPSKCYNCVSCLRQYPLKQLNKRKLISK